MPTLSDLHLRESKRYTGDGQGTPAGFPLPVGNPASGPHIPSKAELRSLFNEVDAKAQAALDAAPRYEYQVFVGDGATSVFTLDYPPSSLAGVDVSISGVTQTNGAAFFLEGLVLTFASPIPAGLTALVKYHVGPTGSTDTGPGRIVTLKSLGATGLMEQDASDYIEDALALNPTLILGEPGAIYRLTRRIRRDGRCVFDGRGCTIFLGTRDACLVLVGGWDNGRPVQTIASFGTNGTQITATGANTLTPGDVCKIVSEQPVPYHPAGTTGLRRGEFFVVQDASGSAVTFPGRLLYNYNTAILTNKVRFAKLSNAEIRISNVTFDSAPSGIPTRGADRYQTGLQIWSANRPIVENVRGGYLYESCLRLVSCYTPIVNGMTNRFGADKAETPFAEVGGVVDGDLMEISSCVHAQITNVHGQLCRHITAIGGNPRSLDASDNDLSGYGPGIGTTVSDCSGYRCSSATFDTHEGSFFTRFSDCTSKFSKRVGFASRGVGNTFDNCHSFGDASGLVVTVGSDYVATSTTNITRWNNGRVTNPVERAFRVDDNGGTLFIDGGVVEFLGGVLISNTPYVSEATTLYDLAGAYPSNLVITGGHSIYARDADLSTLTRIILDRGSVASRIAIHGMNIDFGSGAIIGCPLVMSRGAGDTVLHATDITIRAVSGAAITRLYSGDVAPNSWAGVISWVGSHIECGAVVGFANKPGPNAIDAQMGATPPGQPGRLGLTCANEYASIVSETAGGSSAARTHIALRNSHGLVGSIGTLNNGAVFSTTSDGALKTNLRPLAEEIDPAAILRALDVSAYDCLSAETLQPTGERGYGVVAQNAEAHWPAAVQPRQGEPGESGWTPAGVDYSRFVPLLIAEVVQLRAEIEKQDS